MNKESALTKMKRFLLMAALIALVSACSKDEDKPAAIPPTVEDLRAYFKMTNQQTTAQATLLTAETTGKQTVNGKVIDVTQSTVTTRYDEEGKFNADIKGTIDSKAFNKEYTFGEFVKKPSAYYMATRAQIRWKSPFKNEPENTPIAFDELYRLKQTDKFTAPYLSQWIEFYSSTPDGNSIYIYAQEDVEKTQLSEVKYENKEISFVLSYNGTKGKEDYKERPSIGFDKNKFYKRKVTLNPNGIKPYYMQGVYENLDLFYANALTVEDEKTFFVELVPKSKRCDKNGNTLSCQLSLFTREESNQPLSQFEFEFEGFKPLADLKEEWVLATKSELDTYMKKQLANAPEGDVLKRVEKLPINNWIKMAQMAIRRKGSLLELYCGQGELNNIKVDAWKPVSQKVAHSDILLLSPYFEVLSAQKKGNRLYLQIELTEVNEVSLTGVVAPLEVVL